MPRGQKDVAVTNYDVASLHRKTLVRNDIKFLLRQKEKHIGFRLGSNKSQLMQYEH